MELGEKGHGAESVSAGAAVAVGDRGREHAHWILEKRDGDIDQYVEEHLPGWMKNVVTRRLCPIQVAAKEAELREQFKTEVEPTEVIEFDENLMANVGINVMLDLLMGAAGTAFSNANAYLAVGNGTAAEDAAHTDMQGASKTYKAMNSSYPSVSTTTITFQSDFGSADANYAWEECGALNGNNPPTAALLNRKKQSLGTKASGATWTLTLQITIS